MTAEDDFHDLFGQLHTQLGAPYDLDPDDPHADCWQPHCAHGYTDCDGQPL